MTTLRLIADDLTGALDSAAAFAPAFGSVQVIWNEAVQRSAPALAFDTGTRELDAPTAAARLAKLAPLLAEDDQTIRFFKVDSLLRGNAGKELLALLSAVRPMRVAIAAAIPFQRRITRAGRQMVPTGSEWTTTGEDIAATLRAAGTKVTLCTPGDDMPDGISLWDAETDANLDAIVASAASRPVLWVGAAGLAGALARAGNGRPDGATPPPKPLLGLIGTDHPAMQGQLAECAHLHLTIGADPDAAARAVAARLEKDGAVFVTCDLAGGLDRREIEAEITRRFAQLADNIARPGGLFISGGETLRGLASVLGATAIDCRGQFEPGAPISTMIGGHWDGMPLISKSGAFGTPDFLTRLVAAMATPAKAIT